MERCAGLLAPTCPLFPLLNASLQAWRDYYCDTEDRWPDCARYKMAVTGRPVPTTLLPNGKEAQLLRHAADVGGVGGAEGRRAPQQAPPPRFASHPPQTTVPHGQPPLGGPATPPFRSTTETTCLVRRYPRGKRLLRSAVGGPD